MFDIASLLKLLTVLDSAAASLPEFKKIYDQIVATFGSRDQTTLKQAYVDLMADNDDGHRRLQDKLKAIEGT